MKDYTQIAIKYANKNKYIHFKFLEAKTKTSRWGIVNKNSHRYIGFIQWYPQWRQYCFFPCDDTVFNNTCLTTILQFMDDLRKEESYE